MCGVCAGVRGCVRGCVQVCASVHDYMYVGVCGSELVSASVYVG